MTKYIIFEFSVVTIILDDILFTTILQKKKKIDIK